MPPELELAQSSIATILILVTLAFTSRQEDTTVQYTL